jgi:hypothetical protein
VGAVVSGENVAIVGAAPDVGEAVNLLEMMLKGLVLCWKRNEAESSHWKIQKRKLFAVAAAAAVVAVVLGPALTVEGLHTPLLHLKKERGFLHHHQHHSSAEPKQWKSPQILQSLLHLLLSWLAVEHLR